MANPIELSWTIASLVAGVLHGYLAVQAFLDWRASKEGKLDAWRIASARWYFIGQSSLFIPRLFDIAVGIIAMMIPDQVQENAHWMASIAQMLLIWSEWVGVGAAVSFWIARKALELGTER